MPRLSKICALASVLVAVPATALAASGSSPVPGAWHRLPSAPSAVFPGTSVWTGKQLIVFGNVPNKSADVTAAYDPAANTWSRLAVPSKSVQEPGYKAIWTGKEMLVWGAFHSLAFNAQTKQWRSLRKSLPRGIVVWTGREAIGWGGGCCADAQSNGEAYNPATDTFRKLARSPLAPSQRPLGAWTGRELIVFVSGFGPDGKAWPARLARAAAYDPAANTWRRIAQLPGAGTRFAGIAVWDGREVLAVAAGAKAQSALAYNPTTNQWRRLASLPTARVGAAAVWTGKRLLLWGGQSGNASTDLGDGLAYDPQANRWSTLPTAPLRVRSGPVVAWTGHALIVWGGEIGTPAGTNTPPVFPRDGAAFTTTAP
jgi:N-acetylneuraminic acid mutarotase